MTTFVGKEIERDEHGREIVVRLISAREMFGNDVEALLNAGFVEDVNEVANEVLQDESKGDDK